MSASSVAILGVRVDTFFLNMLTLVEGSCALTARRLSGIDSLLLKPRSTLFASDLFGNLGLRLGERLGEAFSLQLNVSGIFFGLIVLPRIGARGDRTIITFTKDVTNNMNTRCNEL